MPQGLDSGANWVKSSLSFSNGNCVEVANLTDGGVLQFTPDDWRAFIGGVRNGEFDNFGKH
jgi:hypothetical protein